MANSLMPDHIVSLYQGGNNGIMNIQPLCLKCNLKKGRRSVDFRTEEFIAELRREYRKRTGLRLKSNLWNRMRRCATCF